MTITYSMRNVTSELVHMVMIRKFFQMVFVGNDKKSLHIYTATILGASNEEAEQQKFVSELDELKQFRMRFEFAVDSMDDNKVEFIKHEDLTVGSEHCFLDELECISNVWGEKCDIIVNSQDELLKKYVKICPGEMDDALRKKTAAISEKRVLWTEQEKNGAIPEDFQSLSIAGRFENVEEPQVIKQRDKFAARKVYTISVPGEVDLPRGIELVNWVRTTIEFKYPFDDTNLNYIIKKDYGKENACRCKYVAPDFTWYFSPMIRTFIDNRNSSVEVKRGTSGAVEICNCPFQGKPRMFYRNDKFQNSINPVPNKLTVNFHHWTEEERIKYRQKYRLAVHDIFPRPEDFNETSEVSIFLDTSDEHNRGNRQFLIGIFLSIALAFGIDSARLEKVSYCFDFLQKILPVEIWWIIFLVLFSLVWMNKPVKLSEKSRKMMWWRRINIIASAVWFLCVFGILRNPMIEKLLTGCKSVVGLTACIVLLLIFASKIFYLCNRNVNVGKSLWLDLFGDDIL